MHALTAEELDTQIPDGPRWEYQNDDIRDNVKKRSNENTLVVVETSGIGDERIPNGFSWGTGENCDASAYNVVYSSNNHDNPGTVEHEGAEPFLWCK
ncbi:MAG: hypothetical protein Q9163_005556 [Psora crenata]